jgi:outer membrane protein assembly factor BamB
LDTVALTCFDTGGKLLWKKALQIDSPGTAFHFGSSPVIVEDMVIVQDDRERGSYVAAYRLQDGSEIWKVARNERPAQSTPAVAWTTAPNRRPLVILMGTRFIRGLDARSGREVWHIRANTEAASASPVAAENLVIVAAGGSKKPIYAFRADAAGDISLAPGQTNNTGIAWSTERGGAYIPSPLVVGAQVFVLGDNGVLAAYNLHNGRKLFQERAGTGDYYASPVAADGKVYLFNTEGDATVVRAGPSFEVLARNSMNEPTMATPAIADGTIYVRTADHLVALRDAAGRIP